MRAEGGFGLTMTAAAHVQRVGQGFEGQIGCWSDKHLDGLARLARGIAAHDSLAVPSSNRLLFISNWRVTPAPHDGFARRLHPALTRTPS